MANNILETDSCYFTSITSGQPIIPRHDILCFYDNLGNLKWSKIYGDSLEYINDYSMYQDSAKNFTMGAGYYSSITNKNGMCLGRVSNIGDTLWFKSYSPDTSKNYFGAWVLKTKDKGYLLPSSVSDTIDGNIYALKTDSLGSIHWQYELIGSKYDQAYDAGETMNNEYLIVGWTRSFGNGNLNFRDAIVVCIDSAGNYKWKKTFGASNVNETMYRIIASPDGNFIISGVKYSLTAQYDNASIWKIDSLGNLKWQKYYYSLSNLNIFYGIQELPNGQILAVGSDSDTSTQFDQGWIVLLDSLGNILKERRFTLGNDHCIFNDVKQTKDGGL